MRVIPAIALFLSTLPLLAQSVPGSGNLTCVSRSGNWQVEFWRLMREQLEGKDAESLIAKIKGHPVQRMPGTILPTPGNQPPSELLISVEDGKRPDAILRLQSPWTGPALQPGMEIEFDAVAVSVLREPFRFVLAVEPSKVKVLEKSLRHSEEVCRCYPMPAIR